MLHGADEVASSFKGRRVALPDTWRAFLEYQTGLSLREHTATINLESP
jgi:hypothetical protein